MPVGSGRSRRKVINLEKYLEKKRCVIRIQNNDDLCLARALVVTIAKLENASDYKMIVNPRKTLQKQKAEQVHHDANVSLGPCSLEENVFKVIFRIIKSTLFLAFYSTLSSTRVPIRIKELTCIIKTIITTSSLQKKEKGGQANAQMYTFFDQNMRARPKRSDAINLPFVCIN